MNIAGVFGIRLYLPAQAGNEIIYASSQWDVLKAPDIPKQFLARDNLSRAIAHVTQDVELALAECDFLVIAGGGASFEVDF